MPTSQCPACKTSIPGEGNNLRCPSCGGSLSSRRTGKDREGARQRRRTRRLLIVGLHAHCLAAVVSLLCLVLLFFTLVTASAWFVVLAALLEAPNLLLCLKADPVRSRAALFASAGLRLAGALAALVYLVVLSKTAKQGAILPVFMGATVVLGWAFWASYLMDCLRWAGEPDLRKDLRKTVWSGLATVTFQAILFGGVAYLTNLDHSTVTIGRMFSFVSWTFLYVIFTLYLCHRTEEPLWKCALYPTAIPFLNSYISLILSVRLAYIRGPQVEEGEAR